jgi:hypothetical protein
MSKPFSAISKTAFLKYDQCPKAFFLYKKHLYLRDPVSKEKQFTFNRGHEVGKLAHQLFPGGIDASENRSSLEAAEYTQQLLKENKSTIYEATFIYNDVLVMVDILNLENGKWIAYEIKSSLKVSDAYIKDACLQYYVLKNSLAEFNDLFLVTLNGDYVREGELNIKQLFKRRSIKKNAEENIEFFGHQIDQMKLSLEKNMIPDIRIGRHCFSPYECDFVGTCWKNTKTEKSIFRIGRSDREQLLALYFAGVETVDQIDDAIELKPQLRIQANSINTSEPYADKIQLKKFLEKIQGSYCSLDMEIWSPAIPEYNGTKPFEQIPFLFSVSYKSDNEIKYKNFIKPIEKDAREEFLKELINALEGFDHIVVFDKNLEDQVLNKLSNLFPAYQKKVKEIKERLVDLAEPIQNFYFYHPKFSGNFSLKAIAEIFSETSDYEDLEVQSGIMAMQKYKQLLGEENPFIVTETNDELIRYCNMDTLTCLKFLEYLKAITKE